MAALPDLTGDGVPEVLVGDGVFNNARVISPVRLPLHADVDVVNYASGTAQQKFELDAGPDFAGQTYLLLGSLSGVAPGVTAGGLSLPLVGDAYFRLSLTAPNAAPLSQSLGQLDGAGRAQAGFALTGGPASLAGATLRHAFVVIDPLQGPSFVSNAMPLSLFLP